jgi:hypothetical protein
MTMIERVAQAIAEKYALAVNQNAPYAKVMVQMAARAAIEAMREPTQLMEDSGIAEVDELIGENDFTRGNLHYVWRAMIDAALE